MKDFIMQGKTLAGLLGGMFLGGILASVSWAGQIGNTSSNGTITLSANVVYGNTFTATSNFLVSSITVNIPSVAPNSISVTAAIYSAPVGVPVTRLGYCSAPPFCINGDNTLTLSSSVPITSGQQYYLCVLFDQSVDVAYTTPGSTLYSVSSTFPSFPDPITSPATSSGTLRIFSNIGVDFTPTYTYTPTYTPTYTNTPTITPTITPTATITTTITVTSTPTLTPFVIGPDEVVVYPMPAKGSECWFYYNTTGRTEVTIEVYNLAGEKCATVTDLQETVGYQKTRWNIRSVAPGVYLYRVKLVSEQETRTIKMKKMVIVK